VFILPVGFSIIADNPVSKCRGGGSGIATSDFSVQVVKHPLEQTIPQVHISNRVDVILKHNTPWQLAVSETPVVLNTLYVPLVD